jgi:hypothetical protein
MIERTTSRGSEHTVRYCPLSEGSPEQTLDGSSTDVKFQSQSMLQPRSLRATIWNLAPVLPAYPDGTTRHVVHLFADREMIVEHLHFYFIKSQFFLFEPYSSIQLFSHNRSRVFVFRDVQYTSLPALVKVLVVCLLVLLFLGYADARFATNSLHLIVEVATPSIFGQINLMISPSLTRILSQAGITPART